MYPDVPAPLAPGTLGEADVIGVTVGEQDGADVVERLAHRGEGAAEQASNIRARLRR